MKKLQKLQFIMSLLDRVSGPLAKIQQRFDAFTKHTKTGLAAVGVGVGLLATSGYAMANALEPAREMANQIGTVASLDVPVEELKRLENTALRSAAIYGASASEFVGASYDIQSAISGLDDGQLGTVTASMNALAIATKSDVADMTSLMGAMYGIFKDQANQMGVDKFSQTVASMTAKSVQMFKTTGKAMEDAFRGIGSLAKTHGISMQEQFAVLGSLQATMPGAEAGTKYKAFLAGVIKAQSKLGLTFTDSHNKMLPMVDILEKIKGKYGDLDSNEIAKLSKAFGSEEAVMVLTDLIGKTDDLKTAISDVGNADFSLVKEMAMKIADPFDKARFGIDAVSTQVGGLFLDSVNSGMEAVSELTLKLMDWIDANPELAKMLSKLVIGIGAVIAVGATLAIVFGVAQLVMAGFAGVMAILTSPITLIILAVAALAAGAIYLYTHWDSVRASLSESAWGQALLAIIDTVMHPIDSFNQLVDYLSSRWDAAKASLSESAWGQALLAIIDAIMHPIDSFNKLVDYLSSRWDAAKASLSDTAWGKALLGVIDMLMAPLKLLINTFEKAKGFASQKWSGFKSFVGISSDAPKDGGARALGGPVLDNHFYKVNEGGLPEMLQYGGDSYLMTGGVNGNIVPFPRAANDAAFSRILNENNVVSVLDRLTTDQSRLSELNRVNERYSHVVSENKTVDMTSVRESLRPPRSSSSRAVASSGLGQILNSQVTHNNRNTRGNQKKISIGELHIHTTEKVGVDEFEALLDMAS